MRVRSLTRVIVLLGAFVAHWLSTPAHAAGAWAGGAGAYSDEHESCSWAGGTGTCSSTPDYGRSPRRAPRGDAFGPRSGALPFMRGIDPEDGDD